MRTFNKIWLVAAVIAAMSCTESTKVDFQVDKPESIAKMEPVNKYDALKSYVDRAGNPNFKLGAAVDLTEYNKKEIMYRIANNNFDEIVAGYGMKHGAVVQADGSLNLAGVVAFLGTAESKGISVYGHTLCWHSNQNAKYLNSLIAPTSVTGDGQFGPSVITNSTFEEGTSGWGGWGNNSTRKQSNDGEGYNSRYAYVFTNPSAVNPWDAQVAVDFQQPLINGGTYVLTFMAKGSVAGNMTAEMQDPSNYGGCGSFGTIALTTEWKKYTSETKIAGENAKRFLFSYGGFQGSVYIDDVTLCYKLPNVTEKTPAEKAEIIGGDMERWIKQMLEACRYVKAWDVVNEPMSDWPDASQLKTGVGKELAADEFYWQDYLGKDYAVMAFKFARQYGNPGDKLFINDYNLESNLDKCRGLIQYVEYIESKGAHVDGIGTQMHISVNTADKAKIAEMFTLLAATGKLIKITELDIGIGTGVTIDNVTESELKEQARLYEYVVKTYFEKIPVAQRYGITVWSPLDSPKNSSWRAGEPLGLWTLQYNRKYSYAGFANGLAGRDVFPSYNGQ